MKIKVLLVMPGKEPQVVKIPANIKYIKAFIGKKLFRIKLNENTFLIANKEAAHDEFNRLLGENIILGTFFIVSTKNGHRVSMKRKDIRKYTNMFKLKKHIKKINFYKEQYLEEYYSNQKNLKQKNARQNKEIFDVAA